MYRNTVTFDIAVFNSSPISQDSINSTELKHTTLNKMPRKYGSIQASGDAHTVPSPEGLGLGWVGVSSKGGVGGFVPRIPD